MGIGETTLRFGDFELDPERRLLLRNGEPVPVHSKALDVLLVLALSGGRVMSKDALLAEVWEGQFVEENNLTVHISALRKIFGDQRGSHRFIVTIPGKGYKFVGGEAGQAVTGAGIVQQPLPHALEHGIIGRSDEITRIRQILHESDKCLLTLTGPGGSGKTTLARTVTDLCRQDGDQDVYFVELAALDRTEHVIPAIAQALGLDDDADATKMAAITEALSQRPALLVLDNFEQLTASAPVVQQLFERAERLKLIVTSRIALRTRAEKEMVVQPLAVPPQNADLSAEQLSGFAAVELFGIRAQRAKPGFVLTDETAPVIAEICQRLDGLPLAIELAAARVKLLSPRAVLERLDNSLKLLAGGSQDMPERQRTMRNTIRWSYDLLAENERELFAAWAAFAGGCTVEAAEQVCEREDNGGGGTAEVLDSLTLLVDSNLLVSRELADGSVRLSMLDVVREFALERFAELPDAGRLRQRHAEHFLELAEHAEEFLQGELATEWLERLESEHDNLRAALAWSLEHQPQTAARIAAALRFFWANHSHLSEGLHWSKSALETTENTLSEARLKLLMSTGLFLKNHGELDAALRSYEKCSVESRAMGDALQTIKSGHGLAAVAVLQGDLTRAEGYLTESLTLAREYGDELQMAYLLGSFGDLEMCRGDLEAARPLLEECLSLAVALSAERILTTVFFNLGTIDYLEGRYDSSAAHFARSLKIAEAMGNKTMIACGLDGFAALAAQRGQHEHAVRLAGATEALRAKIGCPLEPAEARFREIYLAVPKQALTPDEFTSLYTQGGPLTLAQALSLAREVEVGELGNGE